MASKKKERLVKRTEPGKPLWSDGETWTVHKGKLIKHGRPRLVQSLFSLVAEKLPYESLPDVARDLKDRKGSNEGVYMAHDSMGCPRYIGRGNVIARLKARKKKNPLELQYFSFSLVAEKKHEREVETLLIRAAGPLLHFNEKKKRVDIEAGNVKDYEAGTQYYERQGKKGKKREISGSES